MYSAQWLADPGLVSALEECASDLIVDLLLVVNCLLLLLPVLEALPGTTVVSAWAGDGQLWGQEGGGASFRFIHLKSKRLKTASVRHCRSTSSTYVWIWTRLRVKMGRLAVDH